MAIKYTKHAEEMLILRGVSQDMADKTVNNPDKIALSRDGTKIYLKDFGRNYLMLVISEEMDDKVVVTLHWLAKKRAERL
ncbi:MAG: hypothetical protein AABY07_02220 [Nanoarchaeota archaeon]